MPSMPHAAALPPSGLPARTPGGGWRRHVYTLVALALVGLFLVVFFTGRIDDKHLALVAPRIGLQGPQLEAMVPRVAQATGATRGTVRRIAYLLACSGRPSADSVEGLLSRAATMSQSDRLTPREAALVVLGDSPVHSVSKPIRDC